MSNNPKRNELISLILEDVESDLGDEEILHLLLEQKLSADVGTNAVEKYTLGEKAADGIARFAGSWTFIFSFIAILILWMALNVFFLVNAFDPFPFILLNLVLSCVAAIQAPLIMMSQNRQEKKDRMRAENDYRVNLKTEFIIEDLHLKMDEILENQKKLMDNSEIK